MTDVFEVLGGDHAVIKRMLDALESSPDNSAGANGAVLAARKAVAERLVMDFSAHEAAEEQYFWPIVRERLPDGKGLADQGIGQETLAKQVLNELAKVDSRDLEFDVLVDTIIPACRGHIEFEETQAWPGLRKALSPDESRKLGEKVIKAKKRGPTRPHPRTPPTPAVLATVGPALAAVDKLRDAVAGRR
jgi:hypothetical protein